MSNLIIRNILLALFGLAGIAGINQAQAVPASLNGLGMVSQWTDFANTSGEMPSNPWGNSDIVHANSVGIYVEYANGLTGSATYTGIANGWGGCCDLNGLLTSTFFLAPTTATGFFVGDNANGYAGLHGLDNSGFILPMAWTDLTNQYTSNFDLSFENQNNSTWRADTTDWESVTIALYSSAAAVENVPEPASLALMALGLAGLGYSRSKGKKQ